MQRRVAFSTLFVVVLGVVLVIGLSSSRLVPPGNVGVKVNKMGAHRGVDPKPLGVGRVWMWPGAAEIHTFPVYIQRAAFTKDVKEGRAEDDSLVVNSAEGTPVNLDVAVSIRFDPKMAPRTYELMQMDAQTILFGPVRDDVRGSFGAVACTMPAMDLQSRKMPELVSQSRKLLEPKLAEKGMILADLTLLAAPRMPAPIQEAIDRKVQAEQAAVAAESEVRRVKAEASQKLARAQGEAEATLVQAKAQAEANQTLSGSLTSLVLEARRLELMEKQLEINKDVWSKWNGQLPQVEGANTLMQMPSLAPVGKQP